MAKKLSQKEKIVKGFMCASSMRHWALRFEQYAKDYNLSEVKSMAKEMAEEALNYMNTLR